MPELPEVETVVRGLQERVRGRGIVEVVAASVRLRGRSLEPDALRAALRGRTIAAVQRRAKYVVMPLDRDWTILVHLGMSGRLAWVAPPLEAPPKHTHVTLQLDSGVELRYVDPRRFGLFRVVASGDPVGARQLAGLGPEPLDDEFTVAGLRVPLRASRRAVKELLLDQRIVAGLGNIYVCEALFEAGIDPRTPGQRVAAHRVERLHQAIGQVLRRAVENRGTTLRDYADLLGELGSNQGRLGVYDREGQPCGVCHATVRRIVQAGRSTFYCPTCQRR
jgi:formamidopyrimidine-DNA glycosylase